MATDTNFSDVIAGDDVITGTPEVFVDDVTGESPVVGGIGGVGAMLLANSRATNCCGWSTAEGNSVP